MSRRLLTKLSLVMAMVVFLLSLQLEPATASCTPFQVDPSSDCSQSCYDQVYCDAIECFHQSWSHGGNGQECCFYNTSARFCGSECPLFCAEP